MMIASTKLVADDIGRLGEHTVGQDADHALIGCDLKPGALVNISRVTKLVELLGYLFTKFHLSNFLINGHGRYQCKY